MPLVLALAAAAGLLLPGTIGYYGQNLTAILMVLFFFVGLSVMHTLCRRFSAGRLLLGLFYMRSEEHTSELQSLTRISYAVFCLKKKKSRHQNTNIINNNN